MRSIWAFLNVDSPVDDVRRLGNFDDNRDKDKTLIVKTRCKHHRWLILLLLNKLKTYAKQVYMSKELSPVDQKIRNEALKQRKKRSRTNTTKNDNKSETPNFAEKQTILTTKICTTGKISPQNQNNDYIPKIAQHSKFQCQKSARFE